MSLKLLIHVQQPNNELSEIIDLNLINILTIELFALNATFITET